jgi:hypothetical protein
LRAKLQKILRKIVRFKFVHILIRSEGMPLKSPMVFYCNACLFGYAGVGKMQIQTKGKIGKRTLGVSKKAADVAAKAGNF